MTSWTEKERQNITQVPNSEVRCYIDQNGFQVMPMDAYNSDDHKAGVEDPFDKTFVLNCGTYDGENIDLFDLQSWFDKNREWIDSLKSKHL